jgi:hypothetical protein
MTLGAAFNETRMRLVFEHMSATSGAAPYAPGSVPWRFTARDPERQAELDRLVAEAPEEPVGFEGFLAEVAKAIGRQPNSAVTLDEGAASISLVTAIYDAARSGTRVTLPLPDTHPLYGGWRP